MGSPQEGLLSPQDFVPCPGGPCGHTARKEPLVSVSSFASRVQDPQHPLLGPTPTLQGWGDYWVPRAPRPHQVLAHPSPPRPPSPGPAYWPSRTPGSKDRVHRSWGTGIGACTEDYQGSSYQAVAGQLGLQLPEPLENGVSVCSQGPQDPLQRCPSPGLTALCQSLTKC